MGRYLVSWPIGALLLGYAVLAAASADDIVLIGKVGIAGTERDKSGLTGTLKSGIPQDRLGSMGSGIAYTGVGQRYLLVCDRGPQDGDVDYVSRFHTYDIEVKAGADPAVQAKLVATTVLKNAEGKPLIGLAAAFEQGTRFDAEGIRVGRGGQIFVADEYGPDIIEFNAKGQWQRRLALPKYYGIATPAALPEDEEKKNKIGRAPNGGFEGLAISPDGSKLYGLMEKPLLQDRASAQSAGKNLRLLEVPVGAGKPREFLYVLDSDKYRTNEILAVNDTQFLVIERDNEPGATAKFKRLFLIDIQGATDISGRESLAGADGVKDIQPVSKQPFLDLLDPAFKLAGPKFPQKIEGLAFGPPLDDGRILLLVTSDNDCKAEEPSWIYAFAVPPKKLPAYKPQQFDKK